MFSELTHLPTGIQRILIKNVSKILLMFKMPYSGENHGHFVCITILD
jgi:hypothetical protein